ncbi:MAG: hypothetical protein AMK72_11070 [Planctomycetes bacterium SM23_25]|nr:MAG: hypothetical protein AMK72_11070 [Planctomycetes bacterium SM23_25]
MIASSLFTNPIPIRSDDLLWFLLPLCAAVAVVYKAIRTKNLRHLPLEVAVLMGYMIVGLAILGGALWLLQAYYP